MLTTLIALAAMREDSPKDAFFQAMDHYAKLDSFSAELVHDKSSGLFPGKYRQTFEFVKGKGFKLVVTGLKGGDRPKDIAPDYYCDGKDVTTIGHADGTRPLNIDPNLSPGYEVTGGLIMTWLTNSPNMEMLRNPPQGIEFQFEWGKKETWHDQKVSEITIKVQAGSVANSIDIYFDPERKHLIGDEYKAGEQTGWMEYKGQKDNPKIDAAGFKPPQKL